MTGRKRLDTEQELHFIEQDINYKRAADRVIDCLDNVEFDLFLHDPAYRKSKFKSVRNDIVQKLINSEEIRRIFSFPDEWSEDGDSGEASRQLRDFVELTINAELEVALRRKEPLVEECIEEKIRKYLKKQVPEWKYVIQQRNAEFLSPASRKIIETLIANAIDVEAFQEVLFDDLKERTSMDLFGYFLRRFDVDKAGERVQKYMAEILKIDLKFEVDFILNEVEKGRAELEDDVDSGEIINSRAAEVEMNSSEELPKVVLSFPLEDKGESRSRVVPELPLSLVERISDLVVVGDAGSHSTSVTVSKKHDLNPDLVVEPEPEPEPAIVAVEEFETREAETTPDEVKKAVRNRPILRTIVIGSIAALILVGGTCLLLKPKKSGNSKSKDKIAKNDKMKDQSTKAMKAVSETVPKEVKRADAAVAAMNHTLSRKHVQSATDASIPSPMKVAASVDHKIPKKRTVIKAPRVPRVQSDPNLKRIDVTSVNDLPANYSERFKSLFLGQPIDLNGMPLSEYIERAIRESCTPKQWKQYLKGIGRDLRYAYVLGNQLEKEKDSKRSKWYHEKFKKKQRRWYARGKKLEREYNYLLKKQSSGKKMSSWQKKRLKKLNEMLELYSEFYAGLAHKKLMDKGINVDAVPPGTSVYFSKDGYVPSIIIKMVKAAGLQLPEEFHTSNDTNELSGEIMFAEQDSTIPDTTSNSTIELDDTFQAQINGYELQKKVDEKIKQEAILREERGRVMEAAIDNVFIQLEKNRKEDASIMEKAADKALLAVMNNNAERELKLESEKAFAEKTVDNILTGMESVKVRPAPMVASGTINMETSTNDNHVPLPARAHVPEKTNRKIKKSFFGKIKRFFSRKKAA